MWLWAVESTKTPKQLSHYACVSSCLAPSAIKCNKKGVSSSRWPLETLRLSGGSRPPSWLGSRKEAKGQPWIYPQRGTLHLVCHLPNHSPRAWGQHPFQISLESTSWLLDIVSPCNSNFLLFHVNFMNNFEKSTLLALTPATIENLTQPYILQLAIIIIIKIPSQI